MSVRTERFRIPSSGYADWQLLDRKGELAHVYSNALNTDCYVQFDSLVPADRDMTLPMFLAGGDLEPRTASGLPAAGFGRPAASSARAVSSPGLRGQPLARITDPDTAHEAAATATATATASRMRVLVAHRDAGERGLTGWELEQALRVPYESCGPRRPSLEADGLICATGGKRPNDRGNMQRVYRITEAGRAVADRGVS